MDVSNGVLLTRIVRCKTTGVDGADVTLAS